MHGVQVQARSIAPPVHLAPVSAVIECGAGVREALPRLPYWVEGLLGDSSIHHRGEHAGGLDLDVTTRSITGLACVTVAVPDAAALDAAALQAATVEAYGMVRMLLRDAGAPFPIRAWNFIPQIHELMDEALDRYQVFNLGRFEAFTRWFGEKSRFPSLLPTATGVGHAGRDLWIHMLGSAAPGEAVDNPVQRPAFEYSARYGPRPPCFARATRVTLQDRACVLIGGTASVRGEDSCAPGDLIGQVQVIRENLASLLSSALGTRGHRQANASDAFSKIREVRIYVRHAMEGSALRNVFAPLFSSAERTELVHADICRSELLVEVEALADVGLPPRHGESS